MDKTRTKHIPLYAPNIVNVCVDKHENGELSGRLYHCYTQEPWEFANVIKMVEAMEEFFDSISYPQASTKTRTFTNALNTGTVKLEKVTVPEEAASHRGKKGSFLIHVKYRQQSTWQGEIEWIEESAVQQFASVLELFKILNNALESIEE